MRRIDLATRSWTTHPGSLDGLPNAVAARFADDATIKATVPGCVHDDLLAAGLIPNPYLGTNEAAITWIGRHDWWYATTAPDVPTDAERIDLVADGLDTVATIFLDGEPVGSSQNQHRTYRFNVTNSARTDAELTLRFSSIYDQAAARRAELGPYPAAYEEPFNLTRKMASNFGWDWGPTVVTAGVWKTLRFEAWSTARLARVLPRPRLDAPDGRHGTVDVDVTVERSAAGEEIPLSVTGRLINPTGQVVAEVSAEIAPRRTRTVLTIDAGEVRRWWPCDMGDQPLYTVEVDLVAPGVVDYSPTEGSTVETTRSDLRVSDSESRTIDHDPSPASDREDRTLDDWRQRVGFRDITLRVDPDHVGAQFTLEVASRPIFAKGFNWIPNDLLIHRVTEQDYRARLNDAVACGANLIRVWGGGIFEKDEFYQLCDELGLLVWQDCLFACAAYPESEEFTAEVAAEVTDNAIRLMPHPSLALWNGCNENIWGHEDWGWKQALGERGWGAKFYFETIPAVLREVDPDRPYWPGSPHSGDDEHHPNDPDFGCTHSWVAWNQTDYDHYQSSKPRFVAEFGWCGPAAWSTMRDAVGAEHLRLWDPTYMWHYKSQDGQSKLRRAVADGFGTPTDFDRWHYAQQVQQARAVRFGIDWWRSLWPRCAGAVVWQLNDCWPVISWAAVDSAGIRKPAWYAIREAFADRIAVVYPADDGYELTAVNQSGSDWQAQLSVCRVGVDGSIRATWSEVWTVGPNQTVCRRLDTALAGLPTPYVDDCGGRVYACGLECDEILVVDVVDAATSRRQVVAHPDKRLRHHPASYEIEVAATEDGGLMTLTSHSVIRDLLFQADRLGGVADLELVTLLPGESHQWTVTGMGRPLSVADCVAPVILSAGDVAADAT
ncbi:MAG: glycoside hydrolase family 2 protein [Propionibacteriaceae bacterium]|jgi:beta-mannosidase|nr:glycoside hydrolase family 2 protein [Propionibacteriaceae bacterium]